MSALDDLMEVGAVERSSVTIGGKTFHVQSLSAGQRAALQKAFQDGGQIPEYLTAAHGLTDEHGKPLGAVEEVAEKLKGIKGSVISEIVTAIYRVSALQKEALEEAEKK